MEPVTTLVLAVVVPLVGVATGLALLPSQRFRFEHEGRYYEVRNSLFGETLLVDGVALPNTRVGGDFVSYADHAVLLPDGRRLEVALSLAAAGVQCLARVGEQVVFDSQIRAPVPACLPADPRQAAVQLLLAEIEAAPDLRPAAHRLRSELQCAFQRLEQAGRIAEAHALLGGTDEEVAPLLAHRQRAVDELLGLLRQLHLAACAREVAEIAVPPVHETLRRLEAEREVEASGARYPVIARNSRNPW